MERPTLKSILAKTRPQTYGSVEELDERFERLYFIRNSKFSI